MTEIGGKEPDKQNSRSRKMWNVIGFGVLIAVLVVCKLLSSIGTGLMHRPPIYRNSETVLRDLNVDRESFLQSGPCEQIRIYSIVGLYSLDMGHMIATVPSWMDSAINELPSDEFISCAVEVATERFDSLSARSEPEIEDSLAIHAILYKLSNLDLGGDPRVLDLFDQAVCGGKVRYSSLLTRMYYFAVDRTTITESISTSEMEEALCK